MQNVDDVRLIQGLSLIRLAIAAIFLFALVTVAAPALKPLMVLPSLAYLTGQIFCLRGTGTVGRKSLLFALGTVGLGYLAGFFTESLGTIMVKLFGYRGFILLGILSPLIQVASLIALLVYLRQVSEHYEDRDLTAHFRRLGYVLSALLAALSVLLAGPTYAILSETQNTTPWLAAVGAIAMVFIVSFSGALARLIKVVMAKAQSG